MEHFISEISQFGFIAAIVFVLFVAINFFVKLYGRVRLGKEVIFKPSIAERITLWLSIVYILTYLF
jgi:hypothetical protein